MALSYSFIPHERVPRASPEDVSKNVVVLGPQEVRKSFGAPSNNLDDKEMIFGGEDVYVKLYGDLDIELDHKPSDDFVNAKTIEVRRQLDEIQKILDEESPVRITYKLATRHGFSPSKGCYKLSYRPYFSGVKMTTATAREVWRRIGASVSKSGDAWDLAPFGRNQVLGAINRVKGWNKGFKNFDDRMLKPEHPDDDPLLYIAQHVEDEWEVLNVDRVASPIPDSSGKGDPGIIKKILDGLTENHDYYRWSRVGWAIAYELGTTEDAQTLFREWSAGASNYDPVACDRHIANAQTSGRCCTIKTLMFFLKQDRPDVHATLCPEVAKAARDDFTNAVVDASIEGGHYKLAVIFHSMFPESFAYLGKRDGWFAFRAPRWWHIEGNTEEIIKLMNCDLYDRVADVLTKLKSEEKPDEINVSTVSNTLKSISKITFTNNLVKQLQILYKVQNPSAWLSSLDSNDYILGFEDCVYDFKTKSFRDGTPSDMVSMSTGHMKADVENAGDDIKQEILIALESMHQSRAVYEYVLKWLATSVVGVRPVDRFQIWTGTGANGKGLTKNIAGAAFGDYFYEPTSAIFATRSISGTVLSPELADLKGKRLCITSEGESGDKLKCGTLKQCTGHDKIQARGLYKSPIEFRNTANIAMLFNEVPGNDDDSNGMARRIDIIKYLFSFVTSPKRLYEKLRNENLQERFSSQLYGAAFLSTLIVIFNETGFDFETPDQVKQDSAEYILENDKLGEFMITHFEETDNYSDKIRISDVWTTFTENGYSLKGINTSSDISKRLRKKNYTVTTEHGKAVVRNLVKRVSTPP